MFEMVCPICVDHIQHKYSLIFRSPQLKLSSNYFQSAVNLQPIKNRMPMDDNQWIDFTDFGETFAIGILFEKRTFLTY